MRLKQMMYKHNQEVAAAKSGMNVKTARKYLARILHDRSIKYKFAGLVMLKSNLLQKFC